MAEEEAFEQVVKNEVSLKIHLSLNSSEFTNSLRYRLPSHNRCYLSSSNSLKLRQQLALLTLPQLLPILRTTSSSSNKQLSSSSLSPTLTMTSTSERTRPKPKISSTKLKLLSRRLTESFVSYQLLRSPTCSFLSEIQLISKFCDRQVPMLARVSSSNAFKPKTFSPRSPILSITNSDELEANKVAEASWMSSRTIKRVKMSTN